MCGILGAMFFPTERKIKNRLRAVQIILADAFSGSKERGKDAAGVAMIADDYYAVVKGPWDSEDFMLKSKDEPLVSSILEDSIPRPFDTFHNICRQKEADLSLIMMHTRAKTQGSEYENSNNHPILVPDEKDKDAIIIGVHNGTLRNDIQIRKQLKKEGALVTAAEVDSAAIFEVVHNVLKEEEPTLENMGEIAKWLEGLMAVCVVSRHHPNKVMFWRDGRPLEYVVAENMGVIFFTSDDKYVKDSISRYNRGRLLFPGRLSLPEIKHETKVHTDDWLVLFDTSQKIGTSKSSGYGIAKFAKEVRTPKSIYVDVQAPATSNNWTNNYRSKETDEEKATRYLSTISNSIEKSPATSIIEDLSPKAEQQTVVLVPRTIPDTNSESDDTLVRGEILTKPSSDDIPEIPGNDTSSQLFQHPSFRSTPLDSDEENIGTVVTADVYEAANEELEKARKGRSMISSLEDVIERCTAEMPFDEYETSLEAVKELYDSIFEEAFVSGVAWRERLEEEELAEDLEELKNKIKVTEDNRDEINKLLTKAIKTGKTLRGSVSALKIALKIVVNSLTTKISSQEKASVITEIYEAISAVGIQGNVFSRDMVSNMLWPIESNKSGTMKRIDDFLCNIEEG